MRLSSRIVWLTVGSKRPSWNFFANEWQKDPYAEILKEHKCFVGVNGSGWLFVSDGQCVIRKEIL